MTVLATLITAVIPPFLLLFIGGLSRWMNWLGRGTDRQLSRLIVFVLYPSFIFFTY